MANNGMHEKKWLNSAINKLEAGFYYAKLEFIYASVLLYNILQF